MAENELLLTDIYDKYKQVILNEIEKSGVQSKLNECIINVLHTFTGDWTAIYSNSKICIVKLSTDNNNILFDTNKPIYGNIQTILYQHRISFIQNVKVKNRTSCTSTVRNNFDYYLNIIKEYYSAHSIDGFRLFVRSEVLTLTTEGDRNVYMYTFKVPCFLDIHNSINNNAFVIYDKNFGFRYIQIPIVYKGLYFKVKTYTPTDTYLMNDIRTIPPMISDID